MTDILVVTLPLSSPSSNIPAGRKISRSKGENQQPNSYPPCSNPGHILGDLGTFLRFL